MNRRAALAGTLGSAGALLPSLATAQVTASDRPAGPSGKLRISVAAYSYRQYLQGPRKNMTLLDLIRTVSELGCDGIELTEYYFEKPVTREYVLQLKRACHLWGLDITGTPIGNTFTHPSGPQRDEQVKKYLEWLEFSALLGSPAVRTFAGTAPKGITDSEARRNVIETLEVVCKRAAELGVFVALENHGGVVAEADGLLEIVKAVRSPWLGINLDSGNFRTEDPYGDLARCAPHAVTVQYKVEMMPKGKPKEEADLPRILKILKTANYRGYLTLEYEAAEDPMVAVPRHLQEMRRAIAQA